MSPESRAVHIAQEVEKGSRALRAGEELLALGLCDDAVTRFYYAAFHFASAALLTEGVEASSHRGLVTLFSEHLVRTGVVPAARAKELKRLQAFREAADCTGTHSARRFVPRSARDVIAARAGGDAVGVRSA